MVFLLNLLRLEEKMNQDNEALNMIFSELADELNISETMEKKAISGYENVGS